MEFSSNTIWCQGDQDAYSTRALTIAIVLVVLSISFVSSTQKKKKQPPFAPGGIWKNAKMKMTRPYWMLEVAREIGTYVFQLRLPMIPFRSLITVGDAVVARSLLTDPLTTKPNAVYGLFRCIYGTSTVFTSNGPGWHAKRKAVMPAFSSKHVKRMTRVALEMTDAWIRENLTADEAGAQPSFDVSREMIRIVLSSMSETAFEYELSSEEIQMFNEELKLALTEYAMKSQAIPLRNALAQFIPERRRADAAARNLMALAYKIMDAYRNKGRDCEKGTIIQLIMDSDQFPTEEEKAAQLLEFLIAGHDTTGFSIAFILLELAKNPAEQIKLRESLSQLPPEKWTSSECLQRIVKEGMRLHPVARSFREAGRDIAVGSDGKVLPKGSMCVANFLLLFRNPDVFVEPDAFLPGRWENPTREMLDSFQPFSLGKQNCMGQSLARAEIFGIVARICSEFELEVEEEGAVDFYLTLKPAGTRLRARKVQ